MPYTPPVRTKGWEGPIPVIAAVLVVAALSLLTVTVMSGFGPEDDDVALLDTEGYEPSTSTTSTTVRSTTTTTRPRRSTTTVAPRPSTTEAPQVLGAVTQRVPGSSSSIDGPAPATSTTTGAFRPSPAPAPAPAPTTSPPPPTTSAPTTTTTVVCWNSTDPACGPLSWEPDPGPYDVKAYALYVPSSAYVGERVVFAVNRVERAGADALGACTTWQVSDPGVVSTSSCEEVERSCGRYGPHAPPAASRDEVTHSHAVTFTTPGEHTVRVSGNTATQLADGCASPYLESWSRTYTVIVRER